MAAVISIKVETSGGIEDVKKDVEELGKTAEKSGGGFSAMQEIATGALRQIGAAVVNVAGAAFSKFTEVIGDSISAAKESDMVAAQTAQVIKSAGSAAGVTTQHVLDYASALSAASGKSLFGDEQIAQSTNLLLTFTNIKGATLDAATAISVDMAQALGGAPKDAAIQLGKALNDPIKGITALTRVGVTFTDQQKATIQAMQEAGDTAGAQKIILDELNKEFGGSAEAAAKADGGFAQFQDRLGEMEETIGKALLPVLGQLMGFVNDNLLPVLEGFAAQIGPFFESIQPVIASVTTTISNFASGLIEDFTDAQGATTSFIGDLSYFMDTITGTTGDIGPFQTAFEGISAFITGTLIPAFQTVWTVLQTQVWPILQDLGTALLPLVGAAIQVLTGFWNDVLAPALRNAWTILTTVILPILAAVAGWLKDNLPGAIQATADWLTNTLFPALHSMYDFINANVIPILIQVKDWLLTNVPKAIQATTDFFNNTLLPALRAIWAYFNDNILPILLTVKDWLTTNVPVAIQALTDAWNNVLLPAITTIWTFFKDNIIPIIKTLTEVVIAGLKTELNALAAIWNTVLLPAITAVWNFFHDKIIPIFKELVDVHIAALKAAFTTLSDAWYSTLKPALEAIYNYFYQTLGPMLANFKSNVLEPMATAWANIKTAVEVLYDDIKTLVDYWNSIKPPAWLEGHSPPPMADWFSYIADSVAAVNAQLPTLQMNLAAQVGPSGQSVTNTASSKSFTYAPQISTTGNVSAPMDLALASSLAGV